jgi:hypothetical protein
VVGILTLIGAALKVFSRDNQSRMVETVYLPFEVPYYAQIASPELASAIFIDGLDPIHDPRWAVSGAETPQEYAYWVERACGVACLKMCVEALDGPRRTLVEWARLGKARGGYLVRRAADGSEQEIGWVHSALANMAREIGLAAEARPASLADILDAVRSGKLVIASISYEAGDDRLPITHRGGHLMVVVGAEFDEQGPLAFYVNNPSGRRAELQVGARLPVERFALAYSGRVIVISAPAQYSAQVS